MIRLQSDQLLLQIDEKKVAHENAQSRLADTRRDRALEAENARNQLARGLEELAIMKETNQAALKKAEAALGFKRTELVLAGRFARIVTVDDALATVKEAA